MMWQYAAPLVLVRDAVRARMCRRLYVGRRSSESRAVPVAYCLQSYAEQRRIARRTMNTMAPNGHSQ